jgi:hypothetical protein
MFANFSQLLPHVINLNHVLKKVGRERDLNRLVCYVFWNPHALGYPKSVTKKLCTNFWVNKSLSMMWGPNHLGCNHVQAYLAIYQMYMFLKALSNEMAANPSIFLNRRQFLLLHKSKAVYT